MLEGSFNGHVHNLGWQATLDATRTEFPHEIRDSHVQAVQDLARRRTLNLDFARGGMAATPEGWATIPLQ